MEKEICVGLLVHLAIEKRHGGASALPRLISHRMGLSLQGSLFKEHLSDDYPTPSPHGQRLVAPMHGCTHTDDTVVVGHPPHVALTISLMFI
jgi:hypothetical protein